MDPLRSSLASVQNEIAPANSIPFVLRLTNPSTYSARSMRPPFAPPVQPSAANGASSRRKTASANSATLACVLLESLVWRIYTKDEIYNQWLLHVFPHVLHLCN